MPYSEQIVDGQRIGTLEIGPDDEERVNGRIHEEWALLTDNGKADDSVQKAQRVLADVKRQLTDHLFEHHDVSWVGEMRRPFEQLERVALTHVKLHVVNRWRRKTAAPSPQNWKGEPVADRHEPGGD